nr:hypothetical protein [uncultured Mediterranean phage uvMED]
MSVQVKGSGTIGGLDEGLVVSGIVTSSTQVNVGSNIKLGNAGVVTATSFVGGLPITSGADNRVITASSASAIQGEANLTFDGNDLNVTGASAPEITITSSDSSMSQSEVVGKLSFSTSDPTTPSGAGAVSFIEAFSATSNGSDYTTSISNRAGAGGGETRIRLGNALGQIRFYTNTSGSGSERLRISSNGRVSIGNATNNANPAALLGVIADDGEAADLYVGSFKNLEATAGQSYGVNIQAGSNSTDHGFRVMNKANSVTQFLVRGDGRIGINETSPDRPMHIKDPAQIKLESTGTGNWSGLEFLASSGTNNWDAYMGMNDSNGHFFIDNNSNGNDFVIDRYGYVTKPSQPSFAAFQSQSSWTVNGTMVFGSTRHNVGNHYSTSNGRFTAPTTGSYLFNFFSIYKGNHTSGWVSLYKNGARMTGGDVHFTYTDLGNNWDNVAFNQVLYLSANEYVDMRSAQSTTWHGNNWQCFSGYLLG